jgi:YD repeat-containing protein
MTLLLLLIFFSNVKNGAFYQLILQRAPLRNVLPRSKEHWKRGAQSWHLRINPTFSTYQLGRQTAMQYDDLGRVTQTIYPDGSSEASAYDAVGQRIASTNRLGQVTQ